MQTITCSIFFHNYYGDHEKWLQLFIENIQRPFTLYYNIVEESMYNAGVDANALQAFFQRSTNGKINSLIIRTSSNKGKDIGGKLVLWDTFQKIGSETPYGIFAHDKNSPYKVNNKTWSDHILQVTQSSFAVQALEIFDNNPKTGIVAANGTMKNEYDELTKSFAGTNNHLLQQQIVQYNLFPSQRQFIAGTMFWFRMKPLISFFQKYRPLDIRKTLENGNVLDHFSGSYTHCWERMLTWIVTAEAFKIKTI